MVLSIKSSDVTQAIVDLIDAEKAALGLSNVYFGDVLVITKPPVVAVEGVEVERELKATGHMVNADMSTPIIVFVASIDSPNTSRKDAIELAEGVSDLFTTEANRTLGGLVIFGYISGIEPGYARRGNGPLLHTVRLTWTGKSQGRLI